MILLIPFCGNLGAQATALNDSIKWNAFLKEFDKNLKIVKLMPGLKKEKDRIEGQLNGLMKDNHKKDSLFNVYKNIQSQMQLLFIDEIQAGNQIKAMGNSGVWGSIGYMSMDIFGGPEIQQSTGTKLGVAGVIMLGTYIADWWPYDFWKIKDPTGVLKLIGI